MFWRRRRDRPDTQGAEADEGRPPESPPPLPPPHAELVPIRIFTRDEVLDGWTHLGSQRLSDLLNGEDMLSVSRVEDEPTEDDWQVIEREQIMLAVAPPHASPRQLRVYRQKREIRAESARYAVHGTVHVIPGNRLDRTVLRTRQHFLPITNAHVANPEQPDVEEAHDVVLINVVDAGEDLRLDFLE